MGTSATTVAGLWRFAAQARECGLTLYAIPPTREWRCTSSSTPHLLHQVTNVCRDRKGFMAWQHCIHHALLLAELGWLPDPDDDSVPAVAAAVVTTQEPTSAPAWAVASRTTAFSPIPQRAWRRRPSNRPAHQTRMGQDFTAQV